MRCNINQKILEQILLRHIFYCGLNEGKIQTQTFIMCERGEREIRNSSIQNPFLREKSNSRVSKAQKTS